MTTRLLQIYLLIGLPVYILCTHNLFGQTLGVQDIASRNECRTSRCERSCSCLVFKPKDCAQVLHNGCNTNGVYRIYPAMLSRGVSVYCDQETDGGGWVVFQRRKDGSVDFNRKWVDYKYGFGSVDGEHWLGNELLHMLSSDKPQELLIDLEDFDNNTRNATYDVFFVGEERDLYKLRIFGYRGNEGIDVTVEIFRWYEAVKTDHLIKSGEASCLFRANEPGEALKYSNGFQFSTKDKLLTNTLIPMNYDGGWWYDHEPVLANPNGVYSPVEQSSYGITGIKWVTWKGYEKALKATEFKIRPH